MALFNMRNKFCGYLRRQSLDDGKTEADAVTEYMLENRPAVLTGFQDRWTLLSLRNESAYLSSLRCETGRFDGPEPAALWGLTSGAHDVLVRPPATSMYLHHFFELMNDPTVSETFYLEYLALHIPMPDWLQENLKSVNNSSILDHLVTNVWIGGRPTTSPLHYDDYENFLCQIVGKKELLLFPPDDIGNLYYVGRPKGLLKYKFPGNFTREKNSATPLRVVLSAGDTLYLPAYWHHEVQSLPAEEAESESGPKEVGADVWAAPLNIAVNYWFANLTAPIDDRVALGL
eukprot:gene26831-35523_t